MPSVCRLGDYSTGHEAWYPRPNIQGSPTVFCNNISVHRQGDAWANHCRVIKKYRCHTGVLMTGSSTVYVEGLQCGRIADPIKCTEGIDHVAQGSPNVFCGG